jgi:GAF domain-containing protein/HAMP domain-containing protein
MKNPPDPEISNYDPPTDDLARRQTAFRIVLVLAAAYLAATGLYVFLASRSDVWQLIALTGLMIVLVASTVVGFWLIHKNRVMAAVTVTIVAIAVVFPATMLFEAGLGLTLGIAGLLGTSLIARLTLKPPYENRAVILGVVSAIITILLDFFLPIDRRSFPLIVTYIPVIAGVVITVYVAFVIREFSNYTLRTKLILAFILVALIPLVSLSLYTNRTTRNEIYQNSAKDLTETADTTALQVDTFIRNQLVSIFIESQNPLFIQYMSLTPAQRSGSADEANALAGLSVLARKDTIFIRSYALVDTTGINVLDTNQENVGMDETVSGYITDALTRQQPVMVGPIFDQEDGNASLYFSSPVRNQAGDIIGILRAEYNAGIIQSILNSLFSPEQMEAGRLLAVIDKTTYLRVAYTGSRDRLYKSFKDFSAEEMSALQAQGKLLPGISSNALAPVAQVVAGLQNLEQTPFFSSPSLSLNSDALTTGTSLKNAPWVVLVQQSESVMFEPIENQTRIVVLIALSLIGLAALAAFILSRTLTAPIIRLTSTAEKITKGDLGVRAPVESPDEIGMLARTFNRMTGQLRDILTGLEQRVSDRTNDLKNAVLVSEKRARELQTVSEISRLISSEQRLDVLLNLVTRLVSERFNFYHVGIFFVNDTRQFAVLQAANSEGGKKMLTRGHHLEVGQTGIVGNVAQTGEPRIALDVGSDAVFFNNPDLPNTRSEMALPLNVRGQTIGVLDVQSMNPGAFTENDANTLGILADQVAIAIDNARLFGQIQQARQEAETLYTQTLRKEWNTFSKQQRKIGYRQSPVGGKPLEVPVETEEVREALEKGQVVILDGKDAKSQSAIAVPVKLRGLTIGVLNIKAPTSNRKWSQEEINLAQAISDRLALALENARLFEETTTRAERERLVSDITSKIRSQNDPQTMIQIAISELRNALGASRVEIIPQVMQGAENGKVEGAS